MTQVCHVAMHIRMTPGTRTLHERAQRAGTVDEIPNDRGIQSWRVVGCTDVSCFASVPPAQCLK